MEWLRRIRPGWWLDAALLAALALITVLLAARSGWLFRLARAVADWADAHRPGWADSAAYVLNFLGQGTPLTLLCLAVAVVIGWRRRSLRPLLPVLAGFALTYVTIGSMKIIFGRQAPTAYTPDRVQLFAGVGDPLYVSYPSGHVANAVVWYTVLTVLLRPWLPPRWWYAIRFVPPAVVCFTTTYQSFHWLTDTIAGLLLGLLLGRLIDRVDFDLLPLPGRLR